MNELKMLTQEVKTKNDLAKFVQVLRKNLETNPEQWANADLPSFLEALQAWIGDMEGYYKNQNKKVPDQPTWEVVAEMLHASKYYE